MTSAHEGRARKCHRRNERRGDQDSVNEPLRPASPLACCRPSSARLGQATERPHGGRKDEGTRDVGLRAGADRRAHGARRAGDGDGRHLARCARSDRCRRAQCLGCGPQAAAGRARAPARRRAVDRGRPRRRQSRRRDLSRRRPAAVARRGRGDARPSRSRFSRLPVVVRRSSPVRHRPTLSLMPRSNVLRPAGSWGDLAASPR